MFRAFTLVELLVVISIIVVLLALLSPALDRAISNASSAVCMTNLRNWSLAMMQYATENKGKAPNTSENSPLLHWWAKLGVYVGEPDYATRVPSGYVKANTCPNAAIALGTGIPTPVWGALGGANWGAADLAWEWGTSGAFGMNFWLLPEDLQSSGYAPANFWGRYLNAPPEAPLMGDSIWIGGWPEPGDEPPADTQNGNATSDPTQPGTGFAAGGLMGRWVINRHPFGHEAVNMTFVDGSVDHVRLGDLWKLQWHKNFIRKSDYENRYP